MSTRRSPTHRDVTEGENRRSTSGETTKRHSSEEKKQMGSISFYDTINWFPCYQLINQLIDVGIRSIGPSCRPINIYNFFRSHKVTFLLRDETTYSSSLLINYFKNTLSISILFPSTFHSSNDRPAVTQRDPRFPIKIQ